MKVALRGRRPSHRVAALSFSTYRDGPAATLALEGTLDALSVSELRPEIDDLIATDVRDVAIDLSLLRLIDSVGVGVLLFLFRRVAERGGQVRFSGAIGQPRDVFRLLRLDEILNAAA